MEYSKAITQLEKYKGLIGHKFKVIGINKLYHTLIQVALLPMFSDFEQVYVKNWELQEESYLEILKVVGCKLVFLLYCKDLLFNNGMLSCEETHFNTIFYLADGEL